MSAVGSPRTSRRSAVDLGEHLARLVAATLKLVSGSAISAVVAPVPGNVRLDLAQQLPAEGFVFGADFEIGSWNLYAAKN
jgi:hypothetical protein